ncbi:MAG TPA: hypothetical protein IGS52_05780 [Oscillatoriaceae cyanobacterium M33_DOE_052]|uniref:Uncharacterized protein n=1 Tax=Planktothricoides sp. SpSt-374 TaxID=2282167 RepID=A0A7C3ZJI7_9CYAN|nr:hypothetical protein [Oscillatoriaceae cyanobacterium M33_DOE_052]
MNANTSSIYALNIRLFSYHLRNVHLTDFTERHLEIDLVTSYYQNLLNSCKILDQNSQQINLKFREDFPKMLDSGLANFDLILDSKARGIYRIALPPKYKGFLYPQFLNDTYSFSLTLYHPQKSGDDEISFSELSQLKPPADFFAGTYPGSQDEIGQTFSQAFWGSTIFLSGFIAQNCRDTVENLKSTADELLKQFLGIKFLAEAPLFYQSGEFLGGYIYEYKSIFRPHQYGQILILLIFDETTTDKLNDIQWDLPELFLYYHKNRQNFLDSRQEYKASQDEIKKIEETIKEFPGNIPTNVPPDLSEKDLRLLKREIKNLLDWSLGYSQRIRSLGTFQNTIEINRQNYLDTLSRMEVKSQSDLGIWRDKADRTFERFQRQIEADLVYLQQGERLLDTAINTIRGLVEIDQAERDRQREKTEKDNKDKQEKYNQELQDKIQAVGVGIATGGLVASTSGLITQPWYFPNGKKIELALIPHPFFMVFFGSVLCSLGAWWIATKWIKRGRG